MGQIIHQAVFKNVMQYLWKDNLEHEELMYKYSQNGNKMLLWQATGQIDRQQFTSTEIHSRNYTLLPNLL